MNNIRFKITGERIENKKIYRESDIQSLYDDTIDYIERLRSFFEENGNNNEVKESLRALLYYQNYLKKRIEKILNDFSNKI